MSFRSNTPVLFLVFNRPDLAMQVFEVIKSCKPPLLFIAADGPRIGVENEEEQCRKIREEILKSIDWNCQVKTLFREMNLGCKEAVSSAVNWFFNHVEKGIILEDDTLPESSFFRFCEDLLAFYEGDKRIMMISGDNFQFGRSRTKYSYYFSRYTHVWGWASWKRAWRHYDSAIGLWPEVRGNNLLSSILDDKRQVAYWSDIFNRVFSGEINAWSYQWLFACWLQNGLTILPDRNLVSSIGFDARGTHTRSKSILAGLGTQPVELPLRHPPYILRNTCADSFTERYQYSSPLWYKKIVNLLYGR